MKFLTKPIIITGIVVLVAVVGGLYFGRGGGSLARDTVTVELRDIVQEVSVTGRVKPAQKINLAFERAGKVAWIQADVGDTVSAGALLAGLLSDDISAELSQARASLIAQEAKLEQLIAGVREEEINVQRVKVQNAEKAERDAEVALIDTLRDSYTKSDDAVRNKTDQFISQPRSNDPKLTFTLADTQLKTDIESGRVIIEEKLTDWERSLLALSVESDFESSTSLARDNLNTTASFLSKVALAVNSLKSTATLSQTTIDGYRTDVAAARTNVNTALSNLATAEEELRDSESALSLANEELTLKLAGTRDEEVRAQEASVEEARAKVLNYETQLAKNTLRAPIAGTISMRDAEVGEIVSVNQTVLSMVSKSQFEIEANVSEIDIAKLSVGDVAVVTLDAYGDDAVFEARVVKIDPAEVILEGVPTYKVTFQFLKSDERIRSGMTANITVVTDRREGVIAIPQRAVLSKDGEKIVRLLTGGEVVERPVGTGLKASDGSIEIISGLSPGEVVVVFLEGS